MPIIVDNDGIVYDRWDTWRATREGVGVFTIHEKPEVDCWGCCGQGFRLYEDDPRCESETGWQRLPCPTCWGDGRLPGQVFVVLLERRRRERA